MNLTVLACTSFFFAFCAPAYAASVTVTDPNCGSYAITGSGGDLSLTCASTIPPPVPPNPPSTWNGTCPGFSKTLNIDLPWVSTTGATRILTANYGGFGSNDILVVQLHPPAGSVSTSDGSVSLAEYGGTAVSRRSTISTSACDFTNHASTLYNVSNGSSLGYSLQVGGLQTQWVFLMQPGVTYYLNVRNVGCPAGTTCNMFLDFAKPAGT